MPTLRARLSRIAPYFNGTGLGFGAAIFGSAIGAATEPLVPALMKPLLDKGFNAGALSLWLVPLLIIGLFALRGVAGFLAQYGLSWAANRGILQLRAAIFDRLTSHPSMMFTRHSASNLINTVVYETQGGASQLVYSLLSLVKDSLTCVALLVYLLWTNWELTLIVTVLFPAVSFVMRRLSKRLHLLTVQGQKATDELAYVVEENVLAWRIVRLHGAAPIENQRFKVNSERLRHLNLKQVTASATMTPITQLLTACAISAVIVAALWRSGTGDASVGSFVAFITAMGMLISPVKHLSEVAGPITRGFAAIERGLLLMDEAPAEQGGSYDPGRAEGRIELQEVSLNYRDDQARALNAVSLSVRPGESVALVGPSGSGKSTLVNLLPRFIEPSVGEVRLDGRPLREWNVSALRRQFALVSQDVVLFNDSVADNVSLGDAESSEATRERVLAALKGANLMDFVNGLPQGVDTKIGHNGSELSGGQRQRLAIARAIYKNSPILILDEATSALDSESERLVQAALETLMKGRTSLVIAHRLSTIERADRIIVLDAGRIIEQGTHAELLAHGGLYARLHSLQFRS